MNEKKFKIMHSELIFDFQIIESDLKWIYASMLEGKTQKNREAVSKYSLMQILKELQDLDNSDGKPLIEKDEYNYLGSMFQRRNYWCHEAYLEFAYLKGFKYNRAYNKVSKMLKEDYKIFNELRKRVEAIKLEALDKYR